MDFVAPEGPLWYLTGRQEDVSYRLFPPRQEEDGLAARAPALSRGRDPGTWAGRGRVGAASARAAWRWAGYLRDSLLDRLVPERDVERAEPVRVNFVFHTERVAEAPSYERLLAFVAAFHRATGARPTLCLLTPECPKVQRQLEREGLDADGFGERLVRLLEHAEPGYHGHFYEVSQDEAAARHAYRAHYGREGATPGARRDGRPTWLIPVSHLNPRPALVETQMDRELAWLARAGITPRTYVAGWWHMDATIAKLLAAHGFTVDCSIRRRHVNTFGTRYLEDSDIPPRGEPFLLPPTASVFEVQSIFYPLEHPYRMRSAYADIAAHAPGRPLFVALPSHEGELFTHARAFWTHIRRLSASPAFLWRRVSAFEEEIRQAWPERISRGGAS